MKKLLAALIAATLVLGILAGPSALAGKKKKKKKPPTTRTVTFEESGSMRVPAPARAATGFGVTEFDFQALTGDCEETPILQGHDAWVILLPRDFQLGTAELEILGADATGAHDIDVYFYDGNCAVMDGESLTDGADPAGSIPLDAIWVVVTLAGGANATFDLKATATVPI